MIEQTPVYRFNKIYVHDHNPIRTRHKRNLVVIGDAAHAPLPASGQGTCQALGGAWYLARCLEEAGGDIQLAFNKFTERRYDKTTSIIMAARAFASSLFPRDKDFCAARNANSLNTDFTKVAAGMARGWAQGLLSNA